MCIDMFIDIELVFKRCCRHRCRHAHIHVYAHVYRHGYRHVYTHVCAPKTCARTCACMHAHICQVCTHMCAYMCIDMSSKQASGATPKMNAVGKWILSSPRAASSAVERNQSESTATSSGVGSCPQVGGELLFVLQIDKRISVCHHYDECSLVAGMGTAGMGTAGVGTAGVKAGVSAAGWA